MTSWNSPLCSFNNIKYWMEFFSRKYLENTSIFSLDEWKKDSMHNNNSQQYQSFQSHWENNFCCVEETHATSWKDFLLTSLDSRKWGMKYLITIDSRCIKIINTKLDATLGRRSTMEFIEKSYHTSFPLDFTLCVSHKLLSTRVKCVCEQIECKNALNI